MNQSKTLYLVRHGLSTHSKRGYGKRKLTTPLLPEGRPAIYRLAETLKDIRDSFQVSSEIIRCRETSAIITEVTNKKFVFDSRLNEDYHETIGQVRSRVESFLDDIDTHPQSSAIICTHGVIIAAIKNLLLHGKFVTGQETDHPLTGELWMIKGKSLVVKSFN